MLGLQCRVNAYIINKAVIMTNPVNEDDRHLFKALRAMVMSLFCLFLFIFMIFATLYYYQLFLIFANI